MLDEIKEITIGHLREMLNDEICETTIRKTIAKAIIILNAINLMEELGDNELILLAHKGAKLKLEQFNIETASVHQVVDRRNKKGFERDYPKTNLTNTASP